MTHEEVVVSKIRAKLADIPFEGYEDDKCKARLCGQFHCWDYIESVHVGICERFHATQNELHGQCFVQPYNRRPK